MFVNWLSDEGQHNMGFRRQQREWGKMLKSATLFFIYYMILVYLISYYYIIITIQLLTLLLYVCINTAPKHSLLYYIVSCFKCSSFVFSHFCWSQDSVNQRLYCFWVAVSLIWEVYSTFAAGEKFIKCTSNRSVNWN